MLESGPSATFSNGTVSGSTGCNRYTASYTVDGSELEIGDIATTNMACPPPADAVERKFLAALERVEDWRIEDGELVLGELRFHEASPAGAWDATAFLQRDAVSSPLPGTEVTAVFGEDGTLAGAAGCNTYRATYEIDGAAITIGEPVATKKACTTPEGVMEQEQAYLRRCRARRATAWRAPALAADRGGHVRGDLPARAVNGRRHAHVPGPGRGRGAVRLGPRADGDRGGRRRAGACGRPGCSSSSRRSRASAIPR